MIGKEDEKIASKRRSRRARRAVISAGAYQPIWASGKYSAARAARLTAARAPPTSAATTSVPPARSTRFPVRLSSIEGVRITRCSGKAICGSR